MKKDMKKASPVTFDDLKILIKETAEALGGSLSQDNLDAFLTQYDLDDNAAEELLEFITESNISIEDGLDALDVNDEDLLNEGSADLMDLDDLGDLEGRKRAARKGRNPQTKEEIKIPASKAPVFKAGKALKDLING